MRGIASLYLRLCEDEHCAANSRLVRQFALLDKCDVIDAATTDARDDSDNDNVAAAATSKSTMTTGARDAATIAACAATTAATTCACPAMLRLCDNYLGDAGAAVCMRMLPLLRWLRHVDARGVGAGERAVTALCDVLSTSTREAATTATTADASPHCLALRVVDLRDSDVYAPSARRLLHVLRERLRMWQHVRATTRALSRGSSSVSSNSNSWWWPVRVHIDVDALPPCLAAAFVAYDADACRAHDDAIVSTSTCDGRLDSYNNNNDGGDADDHAVYRLPEDMLRQDNSDGGSSSDAPPPSALVRFVRECNMHMQHYLLAYACLASLHDEEACRVHMTAAQLCVDYGPAALAFVAHSCAAWRWRRHRHAPVRVSFACDELLAHVAALLRSFDVQQHGLLADDAPTTTSLPAWLARRDAQLPQHVARLRVLYDAATAASSDDSDDNDATSSGALSPVAVVSSSQQQRQQRPWWFAPLRALYQRVVAALVTTSLADDVRAMAVHEQRLSALRVAALGAMLDGGACSVAALQSRARALTTNTYTATTTTTATHASHNVATTHEDDDFSSRASTAMLSCASPPRRVWSLWSTQLTYLYRNDAEAARAWRAVYRGASTTTTTTTTEETTQTRDTVVCTCGLRDNVTTTTSLLATSALPRPCASCCRRALQALSRVLAQRHTHARLVVMQPLLDALPAELRLFFVDMFVREYTSRRCACRCRRRDDSSTCDDDDNDDGGCVVYMPDMPGKRGSLHATRLATQRAEPRHHDDDNNDDDNDDDDNACTQRDDDDDDDGEPVCIGDYLAAMAGQRARVSALMAAFEQWYRLRCIEGVDVAAHAAALQRLQTPWRGDAAWPA